MMRAAGSMARLDLAERGVWWYAATALLAVVLGACTASESSTAVEALVEDSSDLRVGDPAAPDVELSELRLQVYDRTGVRLLTSRDVRLAAMGQDEESPPRDDKEKLPQAETVA